MAYGLSFEDVRDVNRPHAGALGRRHFYAPGRNSRSTAPPVAGRGPTLALHPDGKAASSSKTARRWCAASIRRASPRRRFCRAGQLLPLPREGSACFRGPAGAALYFVGPFGAGA